MWSVYLSIATKYTAMVILVTIKAVIIDTAIVVNKFPSPPLRRAGHGHALVCRPLHLPSPRGRI